MKLELQKGSRSRILAAIVLGVMALFVVRLFYLQVIQHEHYVTQANKEQLKQFVYPAKRGVIYGMDGNTPVQMVMNETVYTVFIDPQIIEAKNEAKVIDVIKRVAGGNARPGLEEMVAKKESRYQIVATEITRTQADKIKESKLRGIGFQQGTRRVYPEGSLAGQTLGFVNKEGKGQYGIEGALNDRLTGKDGLLQTVTDVSDVPLTIGDRNIKRPAVNGENIVLSIDRNVQSYAQQALVSGMKEAGATKGNVIVMDPATGKVLAMANAPDFNPAEYNKVTDAADFVNDVVSVPYEPASVIKTFMMSAGIDQGVITPASTYTNTDSIKVYDRTISNALKGHTGVLTMQKVLDWSLNTGTVTVAQRLGGGDVNEKARKIMYDYYHDRFGLGQATGIEVAGEVSGNLISPDKQEGNAVRYSNMSFGQGLDVTTIQVAAGFAAMVNGGNFYTPTVIAGKMETDGTFTKAVAQPERTAIIKPTTSSQMIEMTRAARASAPFLTAKDKKGYLIGGKTGTAETIKNGVYVKNQTIGTYLGYGGDSAPKYVIMVQVSAPGKNLEGGIHAGPIFTDISNWMIDYLKLQPKG